MIESIIIENFKGLEGKNRFAFKEGLNVIVGDNEAGKSTILEAIHLVLTGNFRGKQIRGNVNQYLFNSNVITKYIDSLGESTITNPPHILIEVYLKGDYSILEGDNFSDESKTGKVQGIAMKIALDDKYSKEYHDYIKNGDIESLPVEYFDVNWYSFSRDSLTARSIPIKSTLIDVGFSKFYNGSDIYISKIMNELLDETEKISISNAYRFLKEEFAKEEAIKKINVRINELPKLSKKKIELTVDLSSKSSWNGTLLTHLDSIPFDFIGKGEQAIIKTQLALSNNRAESSNIILLEEPESHISHSRLNGLLNSIANNYTNKQFIISTHSSFIANKLGLDNIILLNKNKAISFKDLKEDTNLFFKKVAGYDTLRFVLSKKIVLVEGDSDELIIQRAYMDNNEGKLPIDDGIDVMSVGTSFLRFLEIGKLLDLKVTVVTDNDGDIDALKEKYKDYLENDNIIISYDKNIYDGDLKLNDGTPFNYNTLEPLIVKENGLELICEILEKNYTDVDNLHKYMKREKTDVALKIFSSKKTIIYPKYIMDAIKNE